MDDKTRARLTELGLIDHEGVTPLGCRMLIVASGGNAIYNPAVSARTRAMLADIRLVSVRVSASSSDIEIWLVENQIAGYVSSFATQRLFLYIEEEHRELAYLRWA